MGEEGMTSEGVSLPMYPGRTSRHKTQRAAPLPNPTPFHRGRRPAHLLQPRTASPEKSISHGVSDRPPQLEVLIQRQVLGDLLVPRLEQRKARDVNVGGVNRSSHGNYDLKVVDGGAVR